MVPRSAQINLSDKFLWLQAPHFCQSGPHIAFKFSSLVKRKRNKAICSFLPSCIHGVHVYRELSLDIDIAMYCKSIEQLDCVATDVWN